MPTECHSVGALLRRPPERRRSFTTQRRPNDSTAGTKSRMLAC
jgi:hypothetical protein